MRVIRVEARIGTSDLLVERRRSSKIKVVCNLIYPCKNVSFGTSVIYPNIEAFEFMDTRKSKWVSLSFEIKP